MILPERLAQRWQAVHANSPTRGLTRAAPQLVACAHEGGRQASHAEGARQRLDDRKERVHLRWWHDCTDERKANSEGGRRGQHRQLGDGGGGREARSVG